MADREPERESTDPSADRGRKLDQAPRDGDASAAEHVRMRLVEAMADAVIATDADFRVIVWNPAAERLYGYTAEEAVGRPARELATFDGDPSRDMLEARLRRAGHHELHFTAQRKSGELIEVALAVTTVLDQAGAVAGYVGVHRDITLYTRVEEERQRLYAVIEKSADVIAIADLDGNALFVNEAGQRLVGLPGMADVRTRHLADFVAPEERDLVRGDLLPRVLAEGRQARELHLVNVETDERIPVSCDAFRIDDPDTHQPIALATISRDLRGRRRADRAIEAYRRQIDAIFASITDACYALDGELRFTYLNDRAVHVLAEILGEPLQARDFLGRGIFELFPEAITSEGGISLRRAFAERREIVFETASRDRWFEVHAYPRDDGLSVYFREITQRRRAEGARERQARQQAAVAELGLRASRIEDSVALMEEGVAVVARTLDVELVSLAELAPEEGGLVLRAGSGWVADREGWAHLGDGMRSLVDAVVRAGEPLVADDIATEPWWHDAQALREEAVTSAAVIPIPGRRAAFGALGVFSRQPRRFDDDDVNFLRAVANVLASAVERSRMARRVQEIRDSERSRIAGALHDETLQELMVARARAAHPPAAADADDAMVATLQRIDEQVREAVYDLRLGDDEDRPFPRSMEDMVDVHRERAPAHAIELTMRDVPERLPRGTPTHLLRIVSEALTNACRHAEARRVEVDVAVADGSLTVSVSDDGVGGARTGEVSVPGGHGIAGMRERAAVLRGDLTITARAGGGTVVTLRAPLLGLHLPGKRVQILLVEDHAAFREAMALAFAEDEGFDVVAQASSLAEARTALADVDVDVAIIALTLPDGDGGDLIGELRAARPEAHALVLTASVDRIATARAVERGAAAVLGKAAHLQDIVSAVRRVRAGEALIPLTEMVDLLRFASRQREHEVDVRRLVASLTPREREVLQLLAEGLDNERVAERLHISRRTQRNHVGNVLTKLGVHSQLQAVLFALRHGVVDVPRGPSAAD